MNWGSTFFLYFLIIIPVLILFIIIAAKNRVKKFSRFASANLFNYHNKSFSLFHWNLKILLLIFALAFVIIAIARPQWDKEEQVVTQEGVDIVICVDVSKSMDATDIKPSRLERAKSHISLFLDELKNDRVGIVAFAGKSMVLCPLTDDYSALKMFVSTLSTETITAYGTNIGSALERAEAMFIKDSKSKIIILISDGEDLENDGMKMSSKIAKDNINVFTIGIGSIDGSPIETENSFGQKEYAKDDNGNTIISKMDVDVLSRISENANGKFYPITPQQTEILDILNQISGKEKSKLSTKQYFKFKEQYHYFLLVAFLFILIETLLPYNLKNDK
jgi:Ca-activated chloride channel family protein